MALYAAVAKLCHESLLAMQAEQAAVGGIFFRRR